MLTTERGLLLRLHGCGGLWWCQFPITAIREMKLLSSLRHDNIIWLRDIVTGEGGGGGRRRVDLAAHCHILPLVPCAESVAPLLAPPVWLVVWAVVGWLQSATRRAWCRRCTWCSSTVTQTCSTCCGRSGTTSDDCRPHTSRASPDR